MKMTINFATWVYICDHALSPPCTADDHVVTFGWNEHGMCGTGDETNVTTPYTVDALRAWRPLLVGSGAGHCLLVAEHRTS